jgi:hypothetical protein
MKLVLIVLLSFANLCYLVSMKPLKQDNHIEVYNEIAIYLIGMVMLNMLNIAMPESMWQ